MYQLLETTGKEQVQCQHPTLYLGDQRDLIAEMFFKVLFQRTALSVFAGLLLRCPSISDLRPHAYLENPSDMLSTPMILGLELSCSRRQIFAEGVFRVRRK